MFYIVPNTSVTCFKFFKMATGHHLGFCPAKSSAIQSADPENLTLESNMECIGSPMQRCGHLKFSKWPLTTTLDLIQW